MGSFTVYQDLLRGRLPLSEQSLQTLCLNNNDPSHCLNSSIYKAFSYPSSLLFQTTHSSFFLFLPTLRRTGELERQPLSH